MSRGNVFSLLGAAHRSLASRCVDLRPKRARAHASLGVLCDRSDCYSGRDVVAGKEPAITKATAQSFG